jgi:hypothetical protein
MRRIEEIKHVIMRYEQIKRIVEEDKTSIEAILKTDPLFKAEEWENIYYGVTNKLQDIIDFIDTEIEWHKLRLSKLEHEKHGD